MSVVSAPKAVATSEEKVKISLNSSEMPEINTESTGQKEREREGAFTQKLLNMNFRMLGRISGAASLCTTTMTNGDWPERARTRASSKLALMR